MKVAVVSNMAQSLVNFRGPLLRGLVEDGHDVLAVAPEREDPRIDTLAAMGVRYRAVSMNRAGIDPLGDVRYLGQLYRLMRSERPDAVLAYTIKPVVYGTLAARAARVPSRTALVNGLGYAFGERRGVRRWVGAIATQLYRAAGTACTAMVFQNPDDRQEFLDRGLVAARKTTVVAGSGIDLERFPYVPARGDGPVFLLIARLIRDKGVLDFVDAARIVRRSVPSARFQLVGPFDDAPGAITQEAVRAWTSEGVVEYLGTTDDVRPLLAGASVFVLPSYYREGTPRTVLEAMATGRPVITSDMPGCRETVRHGENGFLVPVRDPEALAKTMLRFVEEPSLYASMGRASRAYAREKYDVHGVNRDMRVAMGIEARP